MKNYKEYEKMYLKYLNEIDNTEHYNKDPREMNPKDYILFGMLMHDIMESVKLPHNRKLVLNVNWDPINSYDVLNRLNLSSLLQIAMVTSAAMDENVSDIELNELCNKYFEPHGFLQYKQSKAIAEREKAGIDYNPENDANKSR